MYDCPPCCSLNKKSPQKQRIDKNKSVRRHKGYKVTNEESNQPHVWISSGVETKSDLLFKIRYDRYKSTIMLYLQIKKENRERNPMMLCFKKSDYNLALSHF